MDIDRSVRVGLHVDTRAKVRGVYEAPAIRDFGSFYELTAGCVGGIPQDAMQGADLQAFPANSGLFCS
jgi:hypothetical protein